MRVPDSDVDRLLRILTFLDVAQIEKTIREHEAEPERRTAQRLLARETTELVHGRTLSSLSSVFWEMETEGVHAEIEEAMRRAEVTTSLLFGDFSFQTHQAEDLIEALQSSGESSAVLTLPRNEALGQTVVDLAVQVGAVPSKCTSPSLSSSFFAHERM